MLEVIIKQNDQQIGQLQFDSNWKYDDAMKVLGIYIAREIPREAVNESFVRPIEGPGPRQDSEEGLHPNLAGSESEKTSEDEDAYNIPLTPDGYTPSAEDESEEVNLNPSDYQVLDRYAVGKKRVMKFRGGNVTGNQIATLVALRDLGGSIEIANELAPLLKRDARYDSQHVSGTYRMLLGALAEFGWIERAADDSKRIKGVGRKIAAMFPSLPKAKDMNFTAQITPDVE